MDRLFDDPLFQMFAERALMTMTRGGAEYGECEATARRIGAGDAEAWHREWAATAARVEEWGEDSAARGHAVSAREAFLRATTYHRISYYPLFGAPVDPRLIASFARETACFDRFAEHAEQPVLPTRVPFEGSSLPGYLCLPSTGRGPFPTLIAVNGYDSNVHEMYWSHAQPAVRRGYACLLVDGPGQGEPLVRQGLPMRPDWESVLRPVVDHALKQAQVDPSRLAVMGWSFGGYLAPRGVSGDDRIAALVADPGQWDQIDPWAAALTLPPQLADRLPNVTPAELEPYLGFLTEDRVMKWKFLQRGLWVHGLASLGAYVAETGRYRLSDVAEQISCPTLVASAEGDPTAGNADKLFQALRCPKDRVRFLAAEGAAGHCESWNRSRFDEQVFDWLDETLSI